MYSRGLPSVLLLGVNGARLTRASEVGYGWAAAGVHEYARMTRASQLLPLLLVTHHLLSRSGHSKARSSSAWPGFSAMVAAPCPSAYPPSPLRPSSSPAPIPIGPPVSGNGRPNALASGSSPEGAIAIPRGSYSRSICLSTSPGVSSYGSLHGAAAGTRDAASKASRRRSSGGLLGSAASTFTGGGTARLKGQSSSFAGSYEARYAPISAAAPQRPYEEGDSQLTPLAFVSAPQSLVVPLRQPTLSPMSLSPQVDCSANVHALFNWQATSASAELAV